MTFGAVQEPPRRVWRAKQDETVDTYVLMVPM